MKRCLLPLCSKTKINTPLYVRSNKQRIRYNPKKQPRLPVDKRCYVSKSSLVEVIQAALCKLKTGCRWQITSAFSWCGLHLSWAACPATARAGGSKRTCFPCRWPFSGTRHNRSCLVFGMNFNIMIAIFVRQVLTVSQKIDSREGSFWCRMGVIVNACKMDIYLKAPPFAPPFGLFVAKCGAICR